MSEIRRPLVRRGALVAALGLTAAAVSLPAVGAPVKIPLNVGQETTGSNTGAHGFFTYDIEGDTLCYTLEVRRLSAPALAAHIHPGARHTDGPPLVHLEPENATSFTVSDCTTFDADVLADIDENPRAYYVNVHTSTFPGGEIRGQLVR